MSLKVGELKESIIVEEVELKTSMLSLQILMDEIVAIPDMLQNADSIVKEQVLPEEEKDDEETPQPPEEVEEDTP